MNGLFIKPVKKIDEVLLIEDEILKIHDAISAKAITWVNWARLSSAVIREYGDAYLEFAYLACKRNQTKIEPINQEAKEIKQKNLFAVEFFLITALIFLPFQITAQSVSISQGFKFIGSTSGYQGVVDVPLLLCEISVILIVGLISLVLVTSDMEKSEKI